MAETTVKQINVPSFNQAEITYALWRRGNLSWKLDATQLKMYESFKSFEDVIQVWACSRRLGKSFALVVLALETCLKKPNSIVKYIAPEQKQVRTIIRPLIQELLIDCPEDLQPTYKRDDSLFRFANGSEIQLAGCDNQQYEGLRGGKADLCLVDEAGFMSDLKYIVKSVLLPTTLSTNGKIILSSTPPRSSAHEFFTEYVKTAEFNNALVKFTIFDCPRYTEEAIERMVKESGGRDSVEFRREYMAEFITSEDDQIIPEFTAEMEKLVVKEWPRPAHYDTYVGMDVGFKDLTVALFGYWDFRASKLVIEDEVVMRGQKMTTDALAAAIKAKEVALYTHPISLEVKPNYMRVSDNNLILINDLYQQHKLLFMAAEKDDASSALNTVRIMMKSGQIIINPRCRTLILHLKNGVWAKNRKTFDRSPDMGHYDAIDALKYLCRTVQYAKNPYPYGYNFGGGEDVFHTKAYEEGKKHPLEKMFKFKRNR